MKMLITFLLFGFQIAAAQDSIRLPIDSATGKISYSKIVISDSVSKTELFSRAMEWYAHTFNSSKDVIQYSDKDAGKIVGNGIFIVYLKSIGANLPIDVSFTISTLLKDGKSKIILTEFIGKDPEGKVHDLDFDNPDKFWTMWWPKQLVKMKEQLNDQSLAIIDNYSKAMIKKSEVEKF